MGLLRDADQRLQELNSPDVLPVRQLIRDDIAELDSTIQDVVELAGQCPESTCAPTAAPST